LTSIILKPIGISNPAKTDGIYAANEPKPKSTASKISHELLLRFEFYSINIDYGTFRCSWGFPKAAASILPIPCPINSRLLLCRVFVILSAITEVNKEVNTTQHSHTAAYSTIKVYASGGIVLNRINL
jgi:hypothetical protein